MSILARDLWVTRHNLVMVILLCAPVLASAATVTGRITRCGDAVAGLTVIVFEEVQIGLNFVDLEGNGGAGPCVKANPTTSEVGRGVTGADGRYSISFAPSTHPGDFVCSFAARVFVRVRQGNSTLFTSGKVSSGSTSVSWDDDSDCAPEPTPEAPQERIRIRGRYFLCGDPAVSYRVVARKKVQPGGILGLDPALGDDIVGRGAIDGGGAIDGAIGNRCIAQPLQFGEIGETTTDADGTFEMVAQLPVRPEFACSFLRQVRLDIFHPSTGERVHDTDYITAFATTDFGMLVDCARPAFVEVSVKVILDENGERPPGDFNTDRQIEGALHSANSILRGSGVDWRLFLSEIVEVNRSEFHDIDVKSSGKEELEAAANIEREVFGWRVDVINIFITRALGGAVQGICSFPRTRQIIILRASTIVPPGYLFLHEIGHYLSLTHTFECGNGNCPTNVCTGAASQTTDSPVPFQCSDTCPDLANLMSLTVGQDSEAWLSTCQIGFMEEQLYGPEGYRNEVLRSRLPPGVSLPREDLVSLIGLPSQPIFSRGDSNSDGELNISDVNTTLNVLFLGNGSLTCLDAADVNDDGEVNIVDATRALNFLFLGGPPPPAPTGGYCGVDESEDALATCVYERGSCPVSIDG